MEVTCTKPKRHVSFYEIVSIRSTIHTNDMTDEEIDNTWYNRREMTAIKRGMALDVKKMTSEIPMGNKSTTRGLEYRTRAGSEKRRANKFNSIHAVLDEQDLQHVNGINDPEALREIYLEHSERCLYESQQLAKADEIESHLIHKMSSAEDMEIDEIAEVAASSRKSVFSRIFNKKRLVMEEIKQLQISV
jgi:hypothetical protein